jgi:hypothetical protein
VWLARQNSLVSSRLSPCGDHTAGFFVAACRKQA